MRAPRFVTPLFLVGLLLVACSATAPSTDPTRPLAEPIEAVATHDGIQVALGVDRARVAPGGDVAATVLVRNGAPGAVTWQGGGCELQGQFTVTPLGQSVPAPAGQAWPGDKGVIKELALPEATAIGIPVPAEFAHRDDDMAFGCTSELAFNELQPGAETRATVVWVASTAAGVPVPAGDYEVAVTFPYVGRGLAGPPLDFDFADDLTPVTARLVITVDPGAADPAGGGRDGRDPRRSGVHGRARAAPAPDLGVDLDALDRRRLGRPGAVPARRPARGPGRPATGAVIVRDGLAGDR